MPPRSRPPVVLAAFAALIVLIFASSLLSSAPTQPSSSPAPAASPAVEPALDPAAVARPVLVVEQEQDDVDPGESSSSWSARLAAAKHRAFDIAHHLLPSRPAPLSTSPPSSPTRPSLRLLGFDGDASLPECSRTLLYRFRGTRGFASEYLRFVRTAAVAERFGYEVFLADEREDWMYGSIADYFLPPSNRTCRLPSSSPDRRKMLPSRTEVLPRLSDDENGAAGVEWDRTRPERFSAKGLERPTWTREDHVADAYHIPYTSALLLSLFPPTSSTSPSSSAQPFRDLHAAELAAYPPSLPLDGAQTVPPALEPVFVAMSNVARRWWRLEEGIEASISSLSEAVVGEGARKIGLHLRLGDKCRESANPKYGPVRYASDAEFADLKASGRVRNAGRANECGARASGATSGEKGASAGGEEGALWMGEDARVLARAVGAAARGTAAPTGLAMSDDPRGASALQQAWAEQGELPGVELVDLAAVAARIEELEDAAVDDGLEAGFDANVFRDAPLEHRIALTRPFLRDLTLLARESEALVVAQASNVGRLLTLLAGEDLVRSGEVHSVDVRWFPTAYYA
ncbi:hypothetical protein JCM3775_005459 [Rhodotorula graminis]